MALHNCNHSFAELALEVFPAHYARLSASLNEPLKLSRFNDTPDLIPAIAGCYVILLEGRPVYVGIAKNLRRRIQSHLSGDPSRANLAVRVSAKHLETKLSRIKQHPNFSSTFEAVRLQLRQGSVAWVDIPNPLEMYIFEPYCAMILDTSEYNFFDTLQILHPK